MKDGETHDPLLDALAGQAREDEAELSRLAAALEAEGFARLAEGKMSEAERRRLEERSQTDARLAEALAIFAPAPPARTAALEDAVMASLAAPSASRTQVPAPLVADDLARARARRGARLAALVAPVMALAAGLLLYVSVDGQRSPGGLPSYSLSVTGGEAMVRGDDPGGGDRPVRLLPGARLDIVLRPAQAVAAPVTATAYARFPADADPRPLSLVAEVSPTGALRFTVTTAALGAQARGTGQLLFVIHGTGRPPLAHPEEPQVLLPLEVVPDP